MCRSWDAHSMRVQRLLIASMLGTRSRYASALTKHIILTFLYVTLTIPEISNARNIVTYVGCWAIDKIAGVEIVAIRIATYASVGNWWRRRCLLRRLLHWCWRLCWLRSRARREHWCWSLCRCGHDSRNFNCWLLSWASCYLLSYLL